MVRRMVLIGLAVLLVACVANAEEQGLEKYIELLRQDLRSARVAVITEFLPMSEAQAAEFWPIYREYELELAKLTDEWLALLRDYGEHYEEMTDSKAKEIFNRVQRNDKKRFQLKQDYYRKLDRKLPSTLVTRFFQIMNQVEMLIDLQVASEVPLIE
ncbi:hypothetical protein ACFL2Z_01140 [Candidatus Eisenbacteria bacterium]|uniref:Tail specific protease N-terminal domain-containing protein n=1 Tax=Eiseniibacteriota bacterium TaxID=2212470 RepID=A0ABV6YNM2_UNCEI